MEYIQWRIQGGGVAAPLMTGCILKQAKIFHENAQFLHKKIQNFSGKGAQPPPGTPPLPFRPFIPNLWIRHWVHTSQVKCLLLKFSEKKFSEY